MDVSSLAAAMVGAQTGQIQMAIAAKMLKMSVQSDASVLELLKAGQQNVAQLGNVAAGLGQNVDISV